jgi:hypothetical protein
VVEQAGRQGVLEPGDFALVDLSRPARWSRRRATAVRSSSSPMTFDDWTAVESFAGPEPIVSVVPTSAKELLTRFDPHAQHYERIEV